MIFTDIFIISLIMLQIKELIKSRVSDILELRSLDLSESQDKSTKYEIISTHKKNERIRAIKEN